jgi:hypothetical protein
MRSAVLLSIVVTGLVVLGGCAQYPSTSHPIVVNVKSEGDVCFVSLARDPYARPLEFIRVHQDQLRHIRREVQTHRAILVYDVNAQYKCIGATIITLQQAGFDVDVAAWDSR